MPAFGAWVELWRPLESKWFVFHFSEINICRGSRRVLPL